MSRSISAIPLLVCLALPSFAQHGWVTGTVTIDGAPSSGCIMKLEGVCEEHGYDSDEYIEVAYRALSIIRGDSRAHALMLQALKAEDDVIVALAVDGLAKQGDLKALDAIDLHDHLR